jgi:hypothetical protein
MGRSEPSKQQEMDAVVKYVDKWMWDMTMYPIQLDMQLIESKSHTSISETSIIRTSLIRKNKKEMVRVKRWPNL